MAPPPPQPNATPNYDIVVKETLIIDYTALLAKILHLIKHKLWLLAIYQAIFLKYSLNHAFGNSGMRLVNMQQIVLERNRNQIFFGRTLTSKAFYAFYVNRKQFAKQPMWYKNGAFFYGMRFFFWHIMPMWLTFNCNPAKWVLNYRFQ